MPAVAERPTIASRPWLARYDPGVPATLREPGVRLDRLLRQAAARDPDRPALVFFDRPTSYRALDDDTQPHGKLALNPSPYFVQDGKRVPVGTVTFVRQ
jgi:long-chain acyl-CoA synthetase